MCPRCELSLPNGCSSFSCPFSLYKITRAPARSLHTRRMRPHQENLMHLRGHGYGRNGNLKSRLFQLALKTLRACTYVCKRIHLSPCRSLAFTSFFSLSLSLARSVSLSPQSDRENAQGRALLHGYGFGNRKHTSLLSLAFSRLTLSLASCRCLQVSRHSQNLPEPHFDI
jgi:hypothetical protein